MTVSRRTFIQAGVAAGAGLTFLKAVSPLVEASGVDVPTTTYEWRSGVCGLCPNFCGIRIQVENSDGIERAIKIEGDPLNTYNKGVTCARGQAGLRTVYAPNRLKQPMIRVEGSKRGEWDFRAVTWDEAYEYIMARLDAEQVLPHEISIVGGWLTCSSYSSFIVPFCSATGIPNLTASTVQRCMCGHAIGLGSVLGIWNSHAEISSDTENAAFVLNLRTNCSASASAGRMVPYAQGIRNGAVVVTVDPRCSETARVSDRWLPVRPGSDDALLLAIMNRIFTDDTYDSQFLSLHTNAPFLAYEEDGVVKLAISEGEDGTVAEYFIYDEVRAGVAGVPGVSNRNDRDTSGVATIPVLEAEAEWNGRTVRTVFSILRDKVSEYTVEWAAAVCDVSVKDLEWVVDSFSRTRPALIYGGWADARYSTAYMTWKLAGMIQAMTGGIDRDGGWVFSGDARSSIKGFWTAKQAGESPAPVSMKKSLHMINNVFDNPAAWPGNPSLHVAYNETRVAQGEAPHPFTLFADLGLKESIAGELTYQGSPYATKALIMSGVNSVRSFFSESDWREMLSSENVKLIVNIDILPTDTAAYADVILPDLSYLERYDPLFKAESIELTYASRTPVAPVVDGRHTLDIFFDLAERMGVLEQYIRKLAGSMGADPAVMLEQLTKCRAAGRSVAQAFQESGIAKLAASSGRSTDEIAAALGEGAVQVKGRTDLMEGAGIPYVYPAPTDSGRIELHSALYAGLMKKAGTYLAEIDPLVAYTPPTFGGVCSLETLPTDEFLMVYGKAPMMTHTSTADNDLLMAIVNDSPGVHIGVWMNATRAGQLGLSAGETVTLENTLTGQSVDAVLYPTELVRHDTLYFPSNFGHQNEAQETASGVGAALNRLVGRQEDAVAAGSMVSQFIVRVRKA